MPNNLKETLLRLALPAVRTQGLEIWGLEILGEHNLVVRLFVDVPTPAAPRTPADTADPLPEEAAGNGMIPESGEDIADTMAQVSASVDQCEAISRQLSLALDAEDVIEKAYTLEVSTPGFNRIFFSLHQMAPYVGDFVEARLPEPWAPGDDLPARRTWKGVLQEVGTDSFVLAPARVDAEGDITMEDLPPARLPFARTRRVSRVHIFRKPGKPGKQGKAGGKSKGKR